MRDTELGVPPGAEPGGELAVLDDVRGSAKLAALGGAFAVAGAVMLPALLLNGITYWAGLLLGAIFLVVGGGLLLQILPRFQRRRTPFLVITPAGFRCPGLADRLVPWSAIQRARVSDQPIVCTDFFFEPDAVLPVRDRSRANVQLSRRRRQLSIRGPAPRGMALEDYAARISTAIEAAHPAESNGAAP